MSAADVDYSDWTDLLAEIVTPAGKVDYEALAARRDRLDRVIASLAAVSPDSAPERFPGEEHALAYWINAYNAFVLAAVIAEYPIRSVWKVRDGQFFERARHVAGGRRVSLNDIEHRILRGRFQEPRIHFAINCASNGCPPMRPQAYEPDGIGETLDAATRQFLASEWNCRTDDDERKIYVSRIFRMYAEDFVRGMVDSTAAYREGVLRFVAAHTGRAYESIAGHEVVYNVYDWGLNDSHRDPRLRPIRFHESVEQFLEGDPGLRELYLYDGNFCNRDCAWCTVFGSPKGWHVDYSARVLDAAAAHVAPDGNIKFYGGEPTLHAEGLVEAMRYLRGRGFRGLFTIFSNGVRAAALLRVLEADPRTEAVLNYSIYVGRDAEPLPAAARSALEAWAAAHPNRLFTGYKVLYRVGAAADQRFDADREADYHALAGCVMCFPVLRATGEFHACPFAIENAGPHYRLGDLDTPPAEVFANYRRFRVWARTVLDPAAQARGLTSCEMCHRHVSALPTYRDG
ncbi:MAG TPA: DUF547 domain-containing protein [Methylomirabilota bacterium]|nr:DUF547 domain-containing protein [Methylomirabilota bacterium]